MSSSKLQHNHQPIRIGVFGGALREVEPRVKELAAAVGAGIAKRGYLTVTGATTGIPYEAGKAAIRAGGIVLGVSPARDPQEHEEHFRKPFDGCTHIFYTGQGYTGRNYLNLRNCDLAIFIGGEAGTLEEFCVGIYEGLVLGVVTNSGGISAMIPEIVKKFTTEHGCIFCYSTDPESLLDEMLAAYDAKPIKRDWTVGG